MTHVQDLQPMTYIMLFVLFGVMWSVVAFVAASVWYFFMKGITPTPKPTNWESEWEKIEDNLRK
jgi:hypothetical protein